MLAPLWWIQTRLVVAGPTLDPREVAIWLIWSAIAGWVIPLGSLLVYVLLAEPQPVALRLRRLRSGAPAPLTSLDDSTRRIEPLGDGQPWAQLVPLRGPTAGRLLPLTHAVELLGREADNDVILDDDAVSRHHAELRWNGGHPCLVDRASMNGTLHNAQAVHGQVPLESGDIFQLGAHRYRFERLNANPFEETRKVARASGAPASSKSGSLPNGQQLLTLVAANGPRKGMQWMLGALTTIGRDPECEIALLDASVSRRHAQVVRQASGYFVVDLGSSNGAQLNGVAVEEPVRLHPGDVLRVGEIELQCVAVLARPDTRAASLARNRAKPTQPQLEEHPMSLPAAS
jgi:pSer/pThr/pTyr-binding forkhead associated (FHA) protein